MMTERERAIVEKIHCNLEMAEKLKRACDEKMTHYDNNQFEIEKGKTIKPEIDKAVTDFLDSGESFSPDEMTSRLNGLKAMLER